MKQIILEKRFLKDWKILQKKSYDQSELEGIVDMLRNDERIPTRFRDLSLSGNYKRYRECHIRPNWLLIYKSTESEIRLIATGTHDDLFI